METPSLPEYPSEPPGHPSITTSDVPADPLAEIVAQVDTAEINFNRYAAGGNSVKLVPDKMRDNLNSLQTDFSSMQAIKSPLNAVIESDVGKSVRHMVSVAIDSIPALLKILDQVAEIHPFIKLAVGAFRVAVEIDLKRRDNDKKIPLVFAEMRNMMAMLAQLQTIDEHKRAGKENTTISDRMQHLMVVTENDITKCANSCNTYATRRFLSKIVHSTSWSEEFEGHIKTFKSRREEIGFVLTMYTSHTINSVNDNVFNVVEKLDRVLQYLDACRSPEEREFIEIVRAGGGAKAVIEDEKKLRELFRMKGDSISVSGSTEHRVGGTVDEVRFRELRKELQTDVQTAIRENAEEFQAKFIIQQRQLAEGLRQTIHLESNRVINELAGPQDKIRDPDINQIWNDMRWRGSVKGRHFVLALWDHFRDKFDRLKNRDGNSTSSNPSEQSPAADEEEWTLEYIHITRVQPIMEAFDDDASGFITVAEVNAFTRARPDNWSLLKWLAYWAVGHQISMSDYARKIDTLLAMMLEIKQRVLPANRDSIDQYMAFVWTLVSKLTTAFRRVYVDERILHHFEAFTKTEEERLVRNLKEAKFNINAQDTVELICGPGRIETHLFPLLYLLLKHDFAIMNVARTHYLHARELLDSRDAFIWVYDTVAERHRYLEDLFKQQKLDPNQQFKIFAFEMFKYVHNEKEYWSMQKLQRERNPLSSYEDRDRSGDSDDRDEETDPSAAETTVTGYPLQTMEEYFFSQPFVETEEDMQADTVVGKILGQWSGFFGYPGMYPSQEMLTLNLHASSSNKKEFYGDGIASNGTAWNLNGLCSVSEDGTVEYIFNIFYARYLARFPPQYFSGTLDESGITLSGPWGAWYLHGEPGFTFIFKRLTPEVMRFYPTPAELAENKPRALWRFAISATTARVSRNMGSWRWFQERWQIAKRYAALVGDGEDMEHLSQDEIVELANCMRSLTTSEARFYFILQHFRRRAIHWDALCDVCDRYIRGGRIVCLSCGTGTTVDLCENEACLASEVGVDKRRDLSSPHLPSHNVFKMRTAMHLHDIGEMYRSALYAMKLSRELFTNTAVSKRPQHGTSQVNGVGPQLPQCIKCREPASLPCWYCMECFDPPVVVCMSCDAQYGGISMGHHKETHPLVRCQPTPSDVELERVTQLNARIDDLEAKLADLHRMMEQNNAGVAATPSRLSPGDAVPRPLGTGNELYPQVSSPQKVEASASSESEFSVWVRELRSAV